MKPVISIRNLNHYYGSSVLRKQVLFDINLDIQPGEIIIMTGPSGSGKTTLLTLLGGLRSVQNGSLVCLGRELSGASEDSLVAVRRHIGYIFQAHNLLPFMTARQNVCMSLEMHKGVNRLVAEQQASRVLQQVGLGDRVTYYPDKLSGGQKQRVAIARALASQPKLVLADEPTASLDKKTGRDVVDLMSNLVKQQGCTILLVTHDNRILDIADRIIHMEDGRLVSSSPSLSVAVPALKTAENGHEKSLDNVSLEESLILPTPIIETEPVFESILHSPPQVIGEIVRDKNPNNKQEKDEESNSYTLEDLNSHTQQANISAATTETQKIESSPTHNGHFLKRVNKGSANESPNESPNTISPATLGTEPHQPSTWRNGDIALEPKSSPVSASNAREAKPKIYKVACIDDSSTILRSVDLFLDPQYFQTILIPDPVRALALILRHKPDLILLDIMMPNLDGYKLCSMLRKHQLFKNIPIVMVTSRKGFIDKTKAKFCGASGYLIKPFNQTDLMTKIFQYLK